MLIVGFIAMRMKEPIQFKLQCLQAGDSTVPELMDYLEAEKRRQRGLLAQCFDLPSLHAAIVVTAAEMINLHAMMRRSANDEENPTPLEQVEFRWIRDEARRLAKEFGANEEYLMDVLSDILAQYTTLDRPKPSSAYEDIDVQVTVPDGLDRNW